MEQSMAEFDIKVMLRDERDRLLEIRRVVSEDNTEVLRLIDKRLDTIRETLES